MLFDLRGRGRRRTIQVIYLGLALLMGGGLIFFGIGGATSGGLFDAFNSNSGTQSASKIFQDRLDRLQRRTRTNPQDAQAWATLAGLRFQIATTGENYDQTTQAYTAKGKAELRRAETAWDRYLALNPKKPDVSVANQMVQAFGATGLQQYDKAVQALEMVIAQRPPSSGLYAQLAVLAHAAKQDRKSTLAENKALELAPKSQRKSLRTQIQAAEQQLDNAAGAGTPSTQSTTG
jgi:tetratricopeptide (TPR) repeat protein